MKVAWFYEGQRRDRRRKEQIRWDCEKILTGV